MSATEILRRMLDECGVEHKDFFDQTWWEDSDGAAYIAVETRPLDNNNPSTKLMLKRTATPEQAIAATLGPKVTGNTSDGYHTFNELYHHRAMLFSVIVRDHRELAWKSMRHNDGTMYDGMFIVGIETPEGQATYHYDIDPYWDMFNCKELDQAPEWDGHTPNEAIERIATLGSCNRSSNCTNSERTGTCHDKGDPSDFCCSECGVRMFTDTSDTYTMIASDGRTIIKHPNYCPNCGRRVEQ